MAGGLLGFLRFNACPASVFMGDVGSFFIGGALVGICLVTRLSLLLPLIAFAMFVSSLSDIIQMTYFKATHGKRVFRMAPLHHHFELGGMPENAGGVHVLYRDRTSVPVGTAWLHGLGCVLAKGALSARAAPFLGYIRAKRRTICKFRKRWCWVWRAAARRRQGCCSRAAAK